MESALDITKVLRETAADLRKHTENINEVKTGGVSLLDLQCTSLLHYNLNLLQLVIERVNGKSIAEHKALIRLAHIRSIIEKMRPIEQRIERQIQTVVRYSSENAAKNDVKNTSERKGKNNRNKIESNEKHSENDYIEEDLQDERNSDDDINIQNSHDFNTGSYRACKTKYKMGIAVPVDGEPESTPVKPKRRLKASVLSDLHEMMTEAPSEFHEGEEIRDRRQIDYERQKREYEEENFIRLPSQGKKLSKTQMAIQSLDSLLDLDSIVGKKNNKTNKSSQKSGKQRKNLRKFKH